MEEITDFKQEYNNLFKTHIKRDNCAELLEWLNKSDFFIAPASTKFHLAECGGLCKHSVNVFNRLVKLMQNEFGADWQSVYSIETVAICSLLHDVCKAEYYTEDVRNVKENGVWVQKPYYSINDKLPYGHGEKSVYIINGFIRLTREEAIAINWHMGGFDLRVKSGFPLSEVFSKYKLALLLHIADNMATYLDEN